MKSDSRTSDSSRRGGSGYDVRQYYHISSGEVGLRHSVSAVSMSGYTGSEAFSPASVVNSGGSSGGGRGSSDGDCETVGSDNSGGSRTPSYFEIGARPVLASIEHSSVGVRRRKQRRWWWSNMGLAGRRMPGEENIPFLTLLLLRMTSTTASELVYASRWRQLRRYLLHPRTVSVLGGLAVVAPGVGFTVLEKALADDLDFRFPCFLQILIQAMTAVILELSTGRHGFFCRGDTNGSNNSDSVRTGRLVPLAALYAAGMLLAHCARQLQSVHGTYLVAQSALPVVVLVMMGSAAMSRLDFHNRRPLRQQDDAEYVPSLMRFLRRLTAQLIGQSRSSLGWMPENKSDSVGQPTSDSDANGYSSNSSGSADSQESERYVIVCTARWAAIPVAIGAALAAWSPAYSLALIPVHLGSGPWGIASFVWARSLLSAAVSIAGVLVKAQLLVSTSRQISSAPMSAARLLRHLAPLCMLVALVLWPVVGNPVDAIEALTSRILFSSLGVAALGALANIASITMLQAPVSDGALGVAVLAQTRSLTCLAIGWWAYGYLHWSLQTAGFALAVGSITLWSALRLCLPLHPRTPAIVISAHTYRTPRSRKLSSASTMGWDVV